jgi:hypothetical protein
MVKKVNTITLSDIKHYMGIWDVSEIRTGLTQQIKTALH